MTKNIEKICKNCKLFNPEANTCRVVVVIEGEHYELPVLPGDSCFWEKEDIPVQQMRVWTDGKDGFIETTDTD